MHYCNMMLDRMYPLDFEEFLWGANVSEEIIEIVKTCFNSKVPISDYIHNYLMDLFRKYLLVGGMPKAVQTFFDTNDFNMVSLDHKVIEDYIAKDIIKYASENDKLLIKTMYELLPSELNSQTKRFSLKDIPTHFKNENLYLSFGWFTKAGVGIPTYNIAQLKISLELSANRKLVKLFHEDVGLLTYLLMDAEIKRNIIDQGKDINFGAIYENSVAQALTSNGNEILYYYSKHGVGELDFIVQKKGKISVIEVKSGKDYKRHSAINNVLKEKNDDIANIYVLTNNNLKIEKEVIYLPIYMIMFI